LNHFLFLHIDLVLDVMKLLIIILLIVSSAIQEFNCQTADDTESDSLLLSFVYAKHGDVYVGIVQSQNDSLIVFEDHFMGKIIIDSKRVIRTENVYRNAAMIISLGENLKYTGKLIDVDDQFYIFKNEYSDEFKIPRDKIIEVELLKGNNELSNNPNATRYFFAPSAIPLDKGSGYYHNAYLLSNSANVGITKNFSFGGGVIIPLLFYTTPKVGFKVKKNLYVGAGVIAATTIIPDALISGGIPFGLVTVGNLENNITLGAGYGFIWNEGDYQSTDKPIVTLNGMIRISNRIQLVSENWFIPYIKNNEHDNSYQDSNGNWINLEPTITESKEMALAFSIGTRIILNNKMSLDFAPLLLTGTDNSGLVVPYLDFVYKF